MIIEWCARQVKSSGTHAHAVRPLELGDVGDAPLRRPARDRRGRSRRGRSARAPDRSAAARRERAAEQLVRDARQPPVVRVAPAVVRAGERAALHRAERQLELPVGAAVLDRAQRAVGAAVERDRLAPEGHLDDRAGAHRALVLDRVPVVGVRGRRRGPARGGRGPRGGRAARSRPSPPAARGGPRSASCSSHLRTVSRCSSDTAGFSSVTGAPSAPRSRPAPPRARRRPGRAGTARPAGRCAAPGRTSRPSRPNGRPGMRSAS